MNATYIISILAAITISLNSCNHKDPSHDNHEGHEQKENLVPEGVILLNEKQRMALDLKLGPIQKRNLTTVVKTNGELEVSPESIAEITAFIGGNVKEIKVFHGDKVIRGTTLAVLEHPDYITLQEEFAEVANKVEYLEQEYQRQKKLFENEIGAGKDYQRVKSEYNTVKARYSGLRSRLEMLNLHAQSIREGNIYKSIPIKAPISGYVNEVNIRVGSFVDAQTRMFTITDNNAIHADFLVYEKDVHLIQKGQKIHFTVSNNPGKELLATIFAMGKEFEPNTRAVHIHAKLNQNPGNLIPGMYITGHIHTNETYTQTLPESAVVSEGTKSYIFIKDSQFRESLNHSLYTKTDLPENKTPEKGGHDGHDHIAKEYDNEETWAFRRVEVITGLKDEGFVEIRLLDSLSDHAEIVMNAAYYLLADMKKSETKHEH